MEPKESGRRRFLKSGAALAGLGMLPAAVVMRSRVAHAVPTAAGPADIMNVDDVNSLEAVLYGRRSRFVTTVRSIEGMSHPDVTPLRPAPYRPSARTPVGDLLGMITPTSLHFTTQHFYGVPDINPAEHKLMIHGLVDRPLVYTVEDLKRLAVRVADHFVECVGKPAEPAGQECSRNARTDGVQRVDGACRCRCCSRKRGCRTPRSGSWRKGRRTGSTGRASRWLRRSTIAWSRTGRTAEPVRPDHGFLRCG